MRRTKAIRSGSLILVAIAGSIILAACTQTPNSAQTSNAEKRPDVAAMQAKAQSLIDSGRYEEAKAVLERILAIDPTNEFAIGEHPIVAEPHGGFQKQFILDDSPATQDVRRP